MLITNAAAGSADEASVAAVVDVLRDGGDVEVARSASPADLDDALERRPGGLVVVAGGDGTMHGVVAALYRRGELDDAVLGLIPLGTGNDLARGLGIPLEPTAAARMVTGGRPRWLDLIVDDAGGVVVNAVHLGVGAYAAQAARPWKRLLGPASFPIGGVVAGLKAPGWRLRVEADGDTLVDIDDKVLMVGLANTPSIGGGTAALIPDARADEGLIDLMVSRAIGPLARVRYAFGLRRGTHVRWPDVHRRHANTVTVAGEPFPVNADGEISGPIRQRTWTLQPRAWRLLLP